MNRYQPDTPRAAFGIAAVALTVLSLGVLVVAPAALDSRDDAALILARFNGGGTAPIEVVVVPPIEVVGSRADATARTLDVTTAGMKTTAAGLLSANDVIQPPALHPTAAVTPNVTSALAGIGKPDCKPAS